MNKGGNQKRKRGGRRNQTMPSSQRQATIDVEHNITDKSIAKDRKKFLTTLETKQKKSKRSADKRKGNRVSELAKIGKEVGIKRQEIKYMMDKSKAELIEDIEGQNGIINQCIAYQQTGQHAAESQIVKNHILAAKTKIVLINKVAKYRNLIL